ncbi:MAG: sulfatase-like hydrolase/transferase [Phycisphaerae bacterium]|nr:sulfatase-like hydrolase/transferase [Phycisphaerae bacterium]
MNRVLPIVLCVLCFGFVSEAVEPTPNIIVILTDDQLHDTMAYYGGDVLTPNIDTLATTGLVFNHAYVSSTVCAPARYALLTGRYAGRNTSQAFLKHFPAGAFTRIENVNINMERDGMNLQTQLKRKGYATGMVGKWHLGPHLNTAHNPSWDTLGLAGYAQDSDPRTDTRANEAMQANHEILCQQIKAFGWDYVASIYGANLKELKNESLNAHNIDWTVKGALEFLDQYGSQPFFLYFSSTLHHGPDPGAVRQGRLLNSVDADPRYTGQGYLPNSLDVLPSRENVKARVAQAGKPYKTAYCTWLDDAVGTLLKKVQAMGQAQNTLIVYLSDHGIKRYGKSTLYQGGVHIPMIMNWPGHIQPGTTTDALVQNIDLAATFYDYAGISLPSAYRMDGRSLRPILEGDTRAQIHASLFFEMGYARAVMTRDTKYIAVRYPAQVQARIDRGRKFNGFYNQAQGIDERNALDFPYLLNNAHLGHFSRAQNPHYFELDQLYYIDTDPTEDNNILYAEGMPKPERVLTQDQKQRRLAMAALLKEYLGTFTDRPFGEFR